MRRKHLVVLFSAALILSTSGCGAGGADGTTTSAPSTTEGSGGTTTTSTTATSVPETTTTSPPQAQAAVYFLLDEVGDQPGGPFLVPVFREIDGAQDEASSVIDALLAGPTTDEVTGTPSMSTAVPTGTTLRAIDVTNGIATVDLSSSFDDGGGSFSMFARLAQVVFTLTRLEEVDAVSFVIEGTPVEVFSSEGIELDGPQTREDYYGNLPAVFVDQPTWGEPVPSPIMAAGLSNVFEAVHQVMLTDDDGATLYEVTVMATCGTGCWGEWSTEIPYSVDRDQVGALIVWVFSAKDGSRTDVREYPVLLRADPAG